MFFVVRLLQRFLWKVPRFLNVKLSIGARTTKNTGKSFFFWYWHWISYSIIKHNNTTFIDKMKFNNKNFTVAMLIKASWWISVWNLKNCVFRLHGNGEKQVFFIRKFYFYWTQFKDLLQWFFFSPEKEQPISLYTLTCICI